MYALFLVIRLSMTNKVFAITPPKENSPDIIILTFRFFVTSRSKFALKLKKEI